MEKAVDARPATTAAVAAALGAIAADDAAPADRPAAPAIGATERRLATVLLARPPASAATETELVMPDTAALVAGLTSEELIASAGSRLGVSVQRLADGALVAVLVAQEGGVDLTLEHVRTVLGTSTPCIGRERELGSRLRRELGSRLRRELVSRIRQRDENVEAWLGFADPLMERAPFALIGELLRRVLGVVDGEELGTRREKVDAG